jgi:hypothetical protein
MRVLVLIAAIAGAGLTSAAQRTPDSPAGARLEQQSWVTAEKLLTADAVVVLSGQTMSSRPLHPIGGPARPTPVA